MKIPLEIQCNTCKQSHFVFVNLDDTSFQWDCSCGEDISGSFANNVTTGFKLLWRSRYELIKKKDCSLSIVFSATAVECELSRLYFKWNNIAALKDKEDISDDALEEHLRKYRTINTKFEEIAKLMDSRGFSQFVKETDDLRQMINNDFPSLNIDDLSKSFQESLFWPRNRILHLGASRYGHDDAIRCFDIATLALKIFESMDNNKRKNS